MAGNRQLCRTLPIIRPEKPAVPEKQIKYRNRNRGHKIGQMTGDGVLMASSKSPIRSRTKCPLCGSPLFYVSTFTTFLTGNKKRICLAANCTYQEARRFKFVGHYEPFMADHRTPDGPQDRT